MSNFCDHCHGQRFDRARVLRALREIRAQVRASRAPTKADEALALALSAVRALDLPHIELEDEENQVVH